MKTLILLILLIFQNAPQYGLYDSKKKFIGVLSIDRDNLYIKVVGYLPDCFKITFVDKNNNKITYYISNSNMKGYVMILSEEIIVEVIVNKQVTKYTKFYRKL